MVRLALPFSGIKTDKIKINYHFLQVRLGKPPVLTSEPTGSEHVTLEKDLL